MIVLKFANLFVILLITLVAFAGCERVQNMTMEGVSTADTPMPDIATGPPVKMVWFINFPEGGKDAYDNWVLSIAETLLAPEELVRSATYDNVDPDMRPHRYVELEFESYLAAATYMNRAEIATLLQEATNYVTDHTMHTFIMRSDYSKNEAGDWTIKIIRLIDYPLGGKQAYLDWITSSSRTLIEQPELKVVAAYDNYYGTSPHRLITIEFANQVEMAAWKALEIRKTFDAELDKRVDSWKEHTFELQADYIREYR